MCVWGGGDDEKERIKLLFQKMNFKVIFIKFCEL